MSIKYVIFFREIKEIGFNTKNVRYNEFERGGKSEEKIILLPPY